MIINIDDYKMYTYFLLDPTTNEVKIGQTTDPDTRFTSLGREREGHLILIGLIEDRMPLESILHKMFEHVNINGDWFKLSPDLSAMITELNMGKVIIGRDTDKSYTVTCDKMGCGWSGTYETMDSARRGLAAHMGRAHKETADD